MRVPEGWRLAQLSEIGCIHKSRGGSKVDAADEGIPCIRYGELYTQHEMFIRDIEGYVEENRAGSYFPLKQGDVLFAGSGETHEEIGKSAAYTLPQTAVCGGDLLVFRPAKNIHPAFLGYASNSSEACRQKARLGQGSSVIHLYSHHLATLELLIPPLPEQKKIAAILSSVDETIQATRETIEQTKKVKQGLMQELLTRGIGHTRFKMTEIGEIPEEWKVDKLGCLGPDDRPAVKAGPFGSALKKKFYVSSGYKVYGQEQVIANDLSIGDYYIDIKKFTELSSCAINPGDILVSLVGTPGKAVVVPVDAQPGIINPRLVRLSLASGMLPRFVGLVFESSIVQDEIRKSSHGGTMDIVNGRIISNLRIPIPRFKEQVEIVEIIDGVTDSINIHEVQFQQLQLLKKGLIQDLLTGKVRVAV